ncbi:MAG: hypothetical protein IH901_03495 [Proteobacteria bacterium]|nr:hypothetical protein [Pseudomonadota bacterium]
MIDFPNDLIDFCKQRRIKYSNELKSLHSSRMKFAIGGIDTTKDEIKAREEAIAKLDAVIKQFSEAK